MATDADNAAAATAALAAALLGPRRVSGDMGEVEQQSLQDLIAAAKYLESRAAGGSTGLGLRFVRLKPPGAV